MSETSSSMIPPTSWNWGRPSNKYEHADHFAFPMYTLVYPLVFAVPLYLIWTYTSWTVLVFNYILVPLILVASALPIFMVSMIAASYVFDVCSKETLDINTYIVYNDETLKTLYSNSRIPMETLLEAYMVSKVDFKMDLLQALYQRQKYANFTLTMNHVKFFFGKLIPEGLNHSLAQDKEQVTEHYDRGNDFYSWFLGESMIYTSGIFHGDAEETLEQAQDNKLELICRKLDLKEGEKLLDIGCGWGTLARYAAKNYKVDATGVTLAKEQKKWADERIKTDKTEKNCRIYPMDYRDIPAAKYNKISCVEMSEHVGVWKYNTFLHQIRDLLLDDGLFYLQIAGLRRAWQFEDLTWGIFMGTYVFPGADASCPLAWVVWQLEGAGLEVSSVDNIGIHYSATLKRWYDNWISNKDKIVKKYGEHWFRKWSWFLAWAVIASEQGSATCYQIVAHKNTNAFDRKRFIANRSKLWAL